MSGDPHDAPVTVVIPNHNGAAFLAEAVESALNDRDAAGRATVGRVVVADDGSTDDSPAVLAALAERAGDRLRVLRRDGGGACAARNAGLAEVDGPFVKFLDSDDVLEPGATGIQIEQMAAFAGQPVSVYGDAAWADEALRPLPSPPGAPAGLSEAERMIGHPPLVTAPLHRTEDLRRVGGFDARVPRGQEHDLHVRLWLSGVRFEHRPGVTFHYRQHGGPRISSRDGELAVARGLFDTLVRHRGLATGALGDPLPADAAGALARRFWKLGRRTLQQAAGVPRGGSTGRPLLRRGPRPRRTPGGRRGAVLPGGSIGWPGRSGRKESAPRSGGGAAR